MHAASDRVRQLYKILMIVLILILGLLMVGVFYGVAVGAGNLPGFDLGDRLKEVLDAPGAIDANLWIVKTSSHDPVLAGTALTYTLSITNSGAVTATGVLLTDTLPAGVTLLSSNPGSPLCSSVDNVVICSLGDLGAGANTLVTLTVQVHPSVTGALTNNVAVGSSTSDDDPLDNSTSLVTTVEAEADLAIQKSDNPDPVFPTDLLTYTLTIDNNGPSDALDVNLTDNLPQGVGFVSVTPGSPTCARQPPRTITCEFDSLAAGSRTVVTLRVRPDDGVIGPIGNTASLSSAGTDDPDLSNNSSTATTEVLHAADLSLLKTGSASALPPGGTLTYTLEVNNNGPSTALGVLLTDTLPAEVIFQSVTTNKGTCDYTTTVNCQLGSFTSGESALIDVLVMVDTDAPPGTISNSAVISELEFDDPNPDNNSDNYPVVVTDHLVDLSVSKSGDPVRVIAGETLTYFLQVANNGPSNASGVIVTDTLPAGVTLSSAASSQGSCAGLSVVICSLGVITAGDSAQITIAVEVGPAVLGSITNNVEVSSAEAEASMGNNTALVTTPVDAEADLRMVKSAVPEEVIAGTNFTYTLVVNNHGPSLARNLVVVDNLPAEVLFLSSQPGSPTCSHANGVVTCSYLQLTPGASRTITLVVRMSATMVGSLNNQASVAADTDDALTVNNTAAVTVQVTPEIISPTVSWLAPVGNDGTLSVTSDEMILLEAQANDNVGVERVRFYRWDVVIDDFVDINTDYSPPYQAYLDTAVLNPNDWNQIFVKSYDISGNESLRKRILLFRYDLNYIQLYFPLVAR